MSEFEDYRDTDGGEKTKHVNNKLSILPMHDNFKKLNLNEVGMIFDATSSYPSAMWDENSVLPKIETGFAFKPRLNNIFVEAFNKQTFNQDGDEITILKKSIEIHLIWYFNIYRLRRKLKILRLTEWELDIL